MNDFIFIGTADFPFWMASIIAGFFATVLMTITIMSFRVLWGVRMSIPLMLGNMVIPRASDAWRRRVGMTIHLLAGSFFGFLFGFLAQNNILFSEFNGLIGVLYGILLWLFAMMVVFPLRHRGFFGLEQDKRIFAVTFVAHLVYGISFVFLFPLIFLN